jgi:hypothetical protein
MAKRVNKKLRPQEALTSTQIQWDVKTDTPSYYANYMGVSHSPYDFTLSAARIPSPLTREQTVLAKSGQKIPVEPIVQLVMPPLLIDGLIHALMDQKARYEKTAAQQVKNNEIQRQLFKPAGTIN